MSPFLKRDWISYDDPESMRYKSEFIKSRGLGGGMFWELSGDTSVYALLNSLSANV